MLCHLCWLMSKQISCTEMASSTTRKCQNTRGDMFASLRFKFHSYWNLCISIGCPKCKEQNWSRGDLRWAIRALHNFAWNSRGTGVKSARHTGMYLQMSVRSICQYVVTMPRIDRMPCDCNAVLYYGSIRWPFTRRTTRNTENANFIQIHVRRTNGQLKMRTTKWTILIRKHLGIGHLFSGSECNFCHWALYTERVGNELSNIQSGCWFNKKFDYTLSIQLIRCWTYLPEMRFSTWNWHDHYEKHTKLSFWFVSGQNTADQW